MALLHLVYLHNRFVHHGMGVTPFEGYYGTKPDLSSLKVFGSQVCVKRSSNRGGKLDQNNFTGIFLGYTALDQNILYLNLTTCIVKQSHHALFDEAWYLQPHQPPAAQLLYDLGLELDDNAETIKPEAAGIPPWPPLPSVTLPLKKWNVPPICRMTPLPLRETSVPHHRTAATARIRAPAQASPPKSPCSILATKARTSTPSDIVSEKVSCG